MPVVFRKHGLRFVVFVDDHPPPHVHVRGRGEARFMLGDPHGLMSNDGLNRADIARARIAIRENRDELLRVWTDLHG
ncbi:DUF4160 domain-containing protein [Sphingomonas sp.]|uniref:DUF4160 domain-containing protein n=1 Tax=Sphingomonas sp. TaxID=28214 RepID=UPI002D7F0FE2|nr:DUF4160 domain-containing protein [Sphingomonas sp.]HEU0043353.1 DUF4160 domain-containing protein [Sphingomonas sp.]